MSGFEDFVGDLFMSLWHVYFGDVCFISAATFEEFYICMLFGICWRRNVYFLNICIIRVFYRFNRSKALQQPPFGPPQPNEVADNSTPTESWINHLFRAIKHQTTLAEEQSRHIAELEQSKKQLINLRNTLSP